MAHADHYDYISLGSGEAGKYIAWTLASKHGKKCAVIEHRYVGGSCPNVACLPSKNFIASARVAHLARRLETYGLGAFAAANTASLGADMAVVKGRKASMVDGLVQMHLGLFEKTGVELIRGHGVVVGERTVEVEGRRLTTDNLVICTGSTAFVDDGIPGLKDSKPLTHVDILEIETLPAHLIILGAGYVGLEFAQAFARFGSRVTVVEHNSQILKNEDDDVVLELRAILEEEGVAFLTSSRVESVQGLSGDEVTLTISHDGKTTTVRGSHLLAAAGRVPNTKGIGLVEAGIDLTPRGHVKVDEQLRTTASHVYAVGDCAGSPHFTHIGFDDFRVVVSAILGTPRAGGTTGRQVPSVLFTSPELAHVGLREKEAKEQGIAYRLAKLPMLAFLRTRTSGEMRGFAKALVEADGDKILGFTALGSSAGEMLPVVQLAMKLGAGYGEIANLVITHPTMCEGLVSLFNNVPAKSTL